MAKQEIFRSIKIDDNVNSIKLSVFDQLRLIFSKVSNNDVAALDVNEKVSADRLKKVAALTELFTKAVNKARELHQTTVTLKINSEFLPYIDDVLDESTGLGKYYDFKVFKKNLPLSVPHFFIVQVHIRK